jgi:hypothetical protein
MEIDLRKGLLINIEIDLGSWSFIQKLEFYKIMFRCAIVHNCGHIWVDCNNPKGSFTLGKRCGSRRHAL